MKLIPSEPIIPAFSADEQQRMAALQVAIGLEAARYPNGAAAEMDIEKILDDASRLYAFMQLPSFKATARH